MNKENMMILVAVLLTSILTGCGANSDIQLRDGFYLTSAKISSTTATLKTNADTDFLGAAIDKFQQVYGSCDKNVYIDLKDNSFYSKDLDQIVAGLTYNYGNSCDITVAVNPKSSCDTAAVLWHELYHCCQNVSSHDAWVYDIIDMSDAWGKDGSCTK